MLITTQVMILNHVRCNDMVILIHYTFYFITLFTKSLRQKINPFLPMSID